MIAGMIILETVYPSDLVDFPTFVINIAIPPFVFGIQRVEKEETAVTRRIGTGNKATKDFKSCHEVDVEVILSEIGSIEIKEVRR
jgi:hypothetical protein